MKPNIKPMAGDGGEFCRVSRVGSAEEALEAVARAENVDLADVKVVDEGWHRCSFCVCGDDHPYDLWPAKEGERGAFYCYLVGWA